jgi:putative methionine-R-sulfoxide reductase with GAF domain
MAVSSTQVANLGSVQSTRTQADDLSEAQNALSILHDLLSQHQSVHPQQAGSSTFEFSTDLSNLARSLHASEMTGQQERDNGFDAGVRAVLHKLLDSVTASVRTALKAERATIFLVDREKGQLVSRIAHGAEDKSIEIRIPLSTGIAGRVADSGEGMNVGNPYKHPDFHSEVDRSTGFVTKSILCLPMFDRRQSVFAVVQLINKVGSEGFSAADKSLLRDLAPPLGVLLRICTGLQ